ncbi:MAG: metallophosphoesterase family protein [Candidatus Omnitrophota bacterium]|nr:metallophosphoesterase family protein [Candidatus Omnitrophota bacterium]
MRYGIFSDVHSNLEALDAVIEAYRKEKIDKYLCVGDVVGYAANPKECIEEVKALTMVTVAGNHDWAAVNLFSTDYFNPFAKEAIFWTQGNLDEQGAYFLEHLMLIYKNEDFTMVHGTLDEPGDFNYMADGYLASRTFDLLDTGICFVGHTHLPGVFIKSKDGHMQYQEEVNICIKEDTKYIINVGSVGQPRDGNPRAACCIYDTDKKNVQIERISYDIQTARKKIIDRGLPGFLGERLLIGR